MKMDRETKFKIHQINFESGKTIVLEEHLKREFLHMRDINESLQEKVKDNADKIIGLQLELTNHGKGSGTNLRGLSSDTNQE